MKIKTFKMFLIQWTYYLPVLFWILLSKGPVDKEPFVDHEVGYI